MSENLDLVRSLYAAWERGDFFGSTDWAHSQIEFVATEGANPGTWTGIPAFAKAWREILSAFTDFRVDAEEYRELEGGRVLVLYNWSGRGKASGLELGKIRSGGASLFHVHDGIVTRCVIYLDRERALADLGLEE
jgi:ketosteroid isomerase-like protein